MPDEGRRVVFGSVMSSSHINAVTYPAIPELDLICLQPGKTRYWFCGSRAARGRDSKGSENAEGF
jgi:hypothetical protein